MKTLLTILVIISIALAHKQKSQVFLGSQEDKSVLSGPAPKNFKYLIENDSAYKALSDYIFYELDFNENGTLNYEEFFSAVGYVCGWYDVVAPHPSEIQKVFDEVDVEENQEKGELTEDEFHHALIKLGKYIQVERPESANLHFQKVDFDGEIDPRLLEDFPSIFLLEILLSGDELADEFLDFMADRTFAVFDLNGSGDLSLQESILGISYSAGAWKFDVPSFFEIERVFNARDENGDQKLSKKEFENVFIDLLHFALHSKKASSESERRAFKPIGELEKAELKNPEMKEFLKNKFLINWLKQGVNAVCHFVGIGVCW